MKSEIYDVSKRALDGERKQTNIWRITSDVFYEDKNGMRVIANEYKN